MQLSKAAQLGVWTYRSSQNITLKGNISFRGQDKNEREEELLEITKKKKRKEKKRQLNCT